MRATESDIAVKLHLQSGQVLDLSHLVVEYADRSSLNAFPSFGLTVPAVYPEPGPFEGKPFAEFVRLGDILEVGLISTDGSHGPYGLGGYRTAMVGMVQQLSLRQALSGDDLINVCVIGGSSLSGVMLNESVSYFLAYGAAHGVFRARGLVPLEDLNNVRLDAALLAFTRGVAYSMLRIERPQGKLEDLLGAAFKTLDGEGVFDTAWGRYEGSFWGFLQSYADQPLHEVYATHWPLARVREFAGFTHLPRVSWGEDRVVPVLVIRPAPFPYSEDGGPARLDDWRALPVHDLTAADWEGSEERSTELSASEVANFFYVYPRTFNFDEVFNLTYAPVIINDDSWKRHGYRPLSFASWLWGRGAAKEGAENYFQRLNWRLASQHNRRDEFFGGQLTMRLAPHIRVGERIKLRHRVGDDTTVALAYVSGVSHRFSVRGPRLTTLSIERGLAERFYEDGAWFVKGLIQHNPIRDEALPVAVVRRNDIPGAHRLEE